MNNANQKLITYLEPRFKVIDVKPRKVLCLSEGQLERNATEMTNEEW